MARRGMLNRSCVSLLLMSIMSCTTTTGTKSTLTQDELLKLRTLGLEVVQEEEFSVQIARMENTNTGAALFGLVGAGVEAAMRTSRDESVEEQFHALVKDFDLKDAMSERLQFHLDNARVFDKVVNRNRSGEEALTRSGHYEDGILTVTLQEWGLRLCANSQSQVQIGISVEAKLTVPNNDQVVWERNELFHDHECHLVNQFLSEEGLFHKRLLQATDTLAAKMANDVLFP